MKQFFAVPVAIGLLAALAPPSWSAAYNFTKIVDSTTTAPKGTFVEFDSPGVSGDRVVFHSSYPGGNGIFTGSGGPTTTIVKSGDPGPVVPFGGASNPAISGNTVTFRAAFGDVLQASGIFVGSGGPITTIALERDAAPEGTFAKFGPPSISGGVVAFTGTYRGSGGGFKEGVFTGSGGPIVTVAKTGDTTPLGTFYNFGKLSIDHDEVAFVGHADGLPGIYSNRGGTLAAIVQYGDAGPDGTFTGFASPSVGDSVVAFIGIDDQGGLGIYRRNGNGPLEAIVRRGDPAPEGEFLSLYQPLVGSTAIAFSGIFGSETALESAQGIFVDDGSQVLEVIRTGDSLFGSTVASLLFAAPSLDAAYGFDPGTSGNLAFQYVLADGRQGIALATPIPEPIAVLIAGAAVLSIVTFRFRPRSAMPIRYSPQTFFRGREKGTFYFLENQNFPFFFFSGWRTASTWT